MSRKVLLDENLPHKLRAVLTELDVSTVQYMGWAGKKNGELLGLAEAAGFDVLVTGDKTLHFEQDMRERKIAVVSLSAPHWSIIKDDVGKIALAIEEVQPGTLMRIYVGSFSRSRNLPSPPNP